MATDGGKRAERPAESGAEGKQADSKPGAKGTRSAGDGGATGGRATGGGVTGGGATGKAKVAAGGGRPGGSSRGADGEGVRIPYEQARDELTELVKRLEAGGLTLEQSLELWERGERLAAICEEWLEGARAKLAAAMAQRRDREPASGAPF